MDVLDLVYFSLILLLMRYFTLLFFLFFSSVLDPIANGAVHLTLH